MGVWSMVVSPADFKIGVLLAEGINVLVDNMTVLDCRVIADAFPAFGSALLRIPTSRC